MNMATGPSNITAGHVAENHVCIFGDPSDSAGGFSSVFACVAGPNGLLLRGAHFDLSPRWYADVGASLVFTLAVTLCTRNLSSLGLALLYVTKKWCLAGRVRHVEAMKALYTGPRPTLDVLLGKTYAYAAITLIFSTCLPVLYPMLVLYIGVGYCIDKWYLLRICRTPVPYGTSFVHATLWWVQYALILKLALAVWAFGSMPGMLVSDALASLAVDLKSDNSTTTFATTLMKVQALGGKGWLSQRIVTVSSVLLAVGLCLVILLKLLTLIFDHGAKVLSERIVALFSVCCCGGEKQLWPSEYPPFSKVLHGGAPSHRVRVLKRADELGRGEVLALESDIDPSPCRNCVGPLQLLLYLFGIRTFRYKLKSRADFELLKPKANLLVGRANMSYAPIFMPDYAAAFAYGNEDLAGAAADQDYGLPTALSGFL